jgi:hypothetical protein
MRGEKGEGEMDRGNSSPGKSKGHLPYFLYAHLIPYDIIYPELP